MKRGNLRIYLGAAPGVGKTFAMLNEGWRRSTRGTDVVIGFVETHGRQNTALQIRDLEVIPRRRIEHRGSVFEEMDVDAIIARRPRVVLVDELAHTNIPGSKHTKRFEDVLEIVHAGIDVITTVNIQHLESVNDVVEEITGVRQRETVPDEVVRSADQLELVDMSPEALRRRMAHGNIYPAEKVDTALGNYFREGNLSALRELALLWVADRVDDALRTYRSLHGIDDPWETKERVCVSVTGSPTSENLVRRAARLAQRSRADLVAVHVRASDGLVTNASGDVATVRQLVHDLGGEYHEVVGTEVGTALLQFARAENATQIVLGASRRSRWREFVEGSIINSVIRDSGTIDVHVISDEGDHERAIRSPLPRRRTSTISRRRQVWAAALALVLLPVLTVVLTQFSGHIDLTADMLLFVLAVSVIAAIGGLGPALVSAVAASLLVNYYFTPPIHTFTINELTNAVSVVVFIAVASLVSALVSSANRRALDAERARAEAESLASVSSWIIGEVDPLVGVVTQLRDTFDLDWVAVLSGPVDEPVIEASVGESRIRDLDEQRMIEVDDETRLIIVGPAMAAEDQRVLGAFVAQVGRALEHRRLQSASAEVSALEEADILRTSILRAVSHDLRTPLSAIKASVTSLQADDVVWRDEDRDEFLRTIDEESDRLNRLVGNLLDMSRLETGATQVLVSEVALEDVVAAALDGLPEPTTPVVVDVTADIARVLADGPLLERAVANIVANSIRHSPPEHAIRIEAGALGDQVDLRIVDRGPGLGPDQRERIFEPFQRLGDQSPDSGLGLGLAVAKGFIEAMGGELAIEDTPGGGLTAVITLRRAE